MSKKLTKKQAIAKKRKADAIRTKANKYTDEKAIAEVRTAVADYISDIKQKGGGQYLKSMEKKDQLDDYDILLYIAGLGKMNKENVLKTVKYAVSRHEILSQKQIDTLDAALEFQDSELLSAVQEAGADFEYKAALDTMEEGSSPNDHAIALVQLMDAIGWLDHGYTLEKIFYGNSN